MRFIPASQILSAFSCQTSSLKNQKIPGWIILAQGGPIAGFGFQGRKSCGKPVGELRDLAGAWLKGILASIRPAWVDKSMENCAIIVIAEPSRD